MTTTTTYQVTGMTCAHCERAVTQEVSDLAGVAGVDVSAETGRLVVESAEPLDDAAVIAAVDEAGYAATRA
ncbi:heavy-metal-associated domain-containing protein [Pseudoclavibacter sp. 8L]|uniref:heavy-metal-associated domain-containing protein n=1 Tax=Pseudoclavibacter sp. 8L TaxID=2653162 RepID=UPI0012F36769|nr:heavy-metal-associated domain-containing protein [Pseudoclavibacter sp. 8L]VXB83621.1 Heavy metal transporter [Pseudoclavibacter sp. 8L]